VGFAYMTTKTYIHGWIISHKLQKNSSSTMLKEVFEKYQIWKSETEKLDSENNAELNKKVSLLNEYKNYIDLLKEKGIFKLQDKMASSVLEEFLFQLFKNIPNIKSSIENKLIYVGQAQAYTDLSFVPKDFADFVKNPGVYINKKNQDFTISKIVRCIFETNGKQEKVELIVPAVAIECKTFIPSTMLGQSAFEAHRLKQGNPYALYLIVAEQNALSDDVNLKNSPIDEIFILRKQKRNSAKGKVADKKPIDFEVVKDLYGFVKNYLASDWFNPSKATERGRLIKIRKNDE
jgi:hypothetical protein